MLTDVSYGILNQEKCTIFMSLGKGSAPIMAFDIYYSLKSAAHN